MAQVIAERARPLGRGSLRRMVVLTWANTRRQIDGSQRPRLRKDAPGAAVADCCTGFGIFRQTFNRSRNRACEHLAETLTAQSLREFR